MKLVCTEPTIDVVFSAHSYNKHILKVSDEEFKCQSSNKHLISVEDYYQEFNLTENLTLVASYPGTSEGETIVHTFDSTQFCIAFNLVIEDRSARIKETFRICVESEENDSVMVILKAEYPSLSTRRSVLFRILCLYFILRLSRYLPYFWFSPSSTT